jgi:hypothetical protein
MSFYILELNVLCSVKDNRVLPPFFADATVTGRYTATNLDVGLVKGRFPAASPSAIDWSSTSFLYGCNFLNGVQLQAWIA